MDDSSLYLAKRCEAAALLLAAAALLLVLYLHLLPALLGGLLVYELVHVLAPRLTMRGSSHDTGKLIAVAVLATLIVTVITLAVVGLVSFFRSGPGSLAQLGQEMVRIIESARGMLPAWLAQQLPENAYQLQSDVVAWLRSHTPELRLVGTDLGRAIAHALIGMIIGALMALHAARSDWHGQFTLALAERAERLAQAFRRIVFAQVRISALNTSLTAIYLAIVLPLFGVHLPFTKTMIAITFVVGLLPVIGNLISNTVIVIVSLSSSLSIAIGSLAFLVIIHKLEYFMNARIVGTQIEARAWEILLAMLTMEAAFGIAGVVAAPIYYAYLKSELRARRLI